MAENSSTGAMLEMRDAFGQALVEMGCKYPKMIVLDADLHTSSKAGYFKQAFPDRFIQVGIAEQNLFGIAAGLALTGFIPFPSTFAVFATRRALDQIAISICYPKLNVKIPGSYVGLPTSRAGASHNCIEDIAVMRSLPHMRVADPGDNADLQAIIQAAINVDGPVYFRVTRYTLPKLFGPDHVFQWGKGRRICAGGDVTLFSTGMMTGLCLEAADLLARDQIEADLIHMGSIKPIDCGLIIESVKRTGCAVTAENATIIGGLGAAVTEVVAEAHPVPVQRIGVRDRWVDSGGIDELFTHHGMQPKDIAAAAREAIRLKRRRAD
ncbi:MAG: transketolase family protein [Chloroflexales bacterium]|nr:transketolase family protein [Chloroflexales bacterium]